MKAYKICLLNELPPGSRKIVEINKKSIGVFNVKGKLVAVKNVCPHQGAPLCEGNVSGMTIVNQDNVLEYVRDNEILRCPWHAWEFDLYNGKSIYDPVGCNTKTYSVSIEKELVETFEVTVENKIIYVNI